jgi:RNA polymerase sigma factor (sigma-70 family)
MENLETYLLENTKEFVGFARKRLGDPEPAVDAVQDSVLKALKAAKQIRDEEKAKAWFYKIPRRTIIDLYPRRDTRARALAELERGVDGAPDLGEEARIVCACMERLLPRNCRLCAKHDCLDCHCNTGTKPLGSTSSSPNRL